MLSDAVANDNARKATYRGAIIKKIIRAVIKTDATLTPLANDDFPFGYMGPSAKDRPEALFMLYTNMLCARIAWTYGDRIAGTVRASLEAGFYSDSGIHLCREMRDAVRQYQRNY